MPVFKDIRTIKKVALKSLPESEIEVYNTLLWGDLEKIYEEQGSDVIKGRKALVYLIKDWNLTDDKGQKLPVTEETLAKFTPEIVMELLSVTEFAKGSLENLKKKMS